MKHRCKVLRIIPTLDPKYGGPAATIIDSSLLLYKDGFKVDILTADEENSNFIKSKKIRLINKGPRFANFNFGFKQSLWLLNHRHKYDIFIIHGIWHPNTLIARLFLKNKYFVFLHGMIDPYFGSSAGMNAFKKIYKKIYWFLIERKNLLHSIAILLTSLGEKESIKKTFVNTNGIKKKIISYGIIKPKINKKKILRKFFTKFPKFKNKEFYLFLGRFHEKKGCEIIIESVRKLKNNFNKMILLAGPLTKSSYEIKIKKLINNYNLQNKIILSNGLYNDQKWGAIQASKAMILASHGENFGVSLVESLSLGKPVITTTKVNISKEILRSKAGFIANNSVASFSKTLGKFNRLKKKDLNKLKINSLKCFKQNFDLSSTKNSLGSLIKKNLN